MGGGHKHVATPGPAQASTRMIWFRIGVLIMGGAIVALYLFPRIYDLVATPFRLDSAVSSADKYNPALDRIVGHERTTLTAFTALDGLNQSLDSVLVTDRAVNEQLHKLVGQIDQDLTPALRSAHSDVDDFVVSLDSLTHAIKTLQQPVDDAATAVQADRATLQKILDDTAATAAKVHEAALSAKSGADSLSGTR